MKIFAAVALAIVALASTASAKKAKVDFTPFEGTYSGNYSLSVKGQIYYAPVRVKVSVSKSGRVLTLVPSGSLLAESSTIFPLGGSLTLGSGKKAQLNSYVLLPTLFSAFGTGTFSGRKTNFRVVIVTPFRGRTAVSTGNLAFNGRTLNLTLITVGVDNDGNPTTYTLTIYTKRKR